MLVAPHIQTTLFELNWLHLVRTSEASLKLWKILHAMLRILSSTVTCRDYNNGYIAQVFLWMIIEIEKC